MAARPFLCISSILLYPTSYKQNRIESAIGILVVPLLTTQPWFTRILRILTSEPLLLPKSHTYLHFPYRLKNPPNIPNFLLIACHVSAKSIDRKEFYQKLQKSSCNLANQGLEINTTTIRNTGHSFLLNGIKIRCIPI